METNYLFWRFKELHFFVYLYTALMCGLRCNYIRLVILVLILYHSGLRATQGIWLLPHPVVIILFLFQKVFQEVHEFLFQKI